MEKITHTRHNLKKSFIIYILTTFLLVVSLSAAVIASCISIRNWLLPESDEVFLNVEQINSDGTSSTTKVLMKLDDTIDMVPTLYSEHDDSIATGSRYSVSSIESSISSLSPKRKLLYNACGITMIVFPTVLSILGILLCGILFYNRLIKKPISILSQATSQITNQNLDFTIDYNIDNEFGELCNSFNQMKDALRANNSRMWEMLEERKELQASVAHDLRNPIAIIEGHAEYLILNLHDDNLDNDKIISIANNINASAKRMEGYTESIRTLNHIEELDVNKVSVNFIDLYKDIASDLNILVKKEGLELVAENNVNSCSILLDTQVLYRILENLVSNSVRYARHIIHMSFSLEATDLSITITDDGDGYNESILNSKHGYISLDKDDDSHYGLGLVICRLLCKKHGGNLKLSNSSSGGAVAQITLSV